MYERFQEIKAGAGLTLSAVSASATWLVTLNDVLQIIATVTAIAAGAASAYYYFKKGRESDRG